MKVLHVITGISRTGGGPSRSSQGLVAALNAAGVEAWLCSLDGQVPWIRGVRHFQQDLTLQTLRQFSLVHIHGIWSLKLHQVAVLCRRAGVPYVIAPRGMLEPWSLQQKWLKKRLARFLYQDRDLRHAAALHATAESEAEQFRKLGFRNRVVVSPNGVNLPEVPVERAVARQDGECRRALFVSRMHPKKGVLELVEAWSKVKRSGNVPIQSWSCELVYTLNSDLERQYEVEVKQRILDLGLTYVDGEKARQVESLNGSVDFIFTGALDDYAKWNAYARADLFVLPTYSENFGIVVAEALWAGVPVITTKGTPWKDLVDHKCGWWIDQGVDALVAALREATTPSPTLHGSENLLQQMGENGHQLVLDKYSWPAIAQTVIKGYQEVLHVS